MDEGEGESWKGGGGGEGGEGEVEAAKVCGRLARGGKMEERAH